MVFTETANKPNEDEPQERLFANCRMRKVCETAPEMLPGVIKQPCKNIVS